MSPRTSSRFRARTLRRLAAFTLTEILIAVGVLVVVVVAAAKIFGAASKVAAVAEANADLLQTASAIEAQIRADIANLPENSFLVLQQVEVNRFGSAQTLDPTLGTAEIRADQLAFFARGVRTTQQFTGYDQYIGTSDTVASRWLPQSAVARVYYGHGVQAPTIAKGFGPLSYDGSNAPLVPWRSGRVETQRWSDGTVGALTTVTAARPSQWPLARIATLMTTDGVGSRSFADTTVNATRRLFTRAGNLNVQPAPLTVGTTVDTLFDPLWTSSRVDICKWQMDDLFSQTAYQYTTAGGAQLLPYIPADPTQILSVPSTRLRMLQTLSPWAIRATQANPAAASNPNLNHFVAYPRVEKAALGPERAELMLTAPVLASYCSNFKVEWTWDDGVGRSWDGRTGLGPNGELNGFEPIGMFVKPNAQRPWFGMDDGIPGSLVNPVSSAFLYTLNSGALPDPASTNNWGCVGFPLIVADQLSDHVYCSVEGPRNSLNNSVIWTTSSGQDSKRVYQAVFGFNRNDPSVWAPDARNYGPYTPLPSALRITLRLHDPLGRIEGGREFQFIVDLPRR